MKNRFSQKFPCSGGSPYQSVFPEVRNRNQTESGLCNASTQSSPGVKVAKSIFADSDWSHLLKLVATGREGATDGR